MIRLSSFTLAILLLFSGPAVAQEPTADEIIDKALDQNAMGFQSGKAQLTLTIEPLHYPAGSSSGCYPTHPQWCRG